MQSNTVITRGTPVLATVQGDAVEAFTQVDRQDWALLRLVVCVALSTGIMAVASSLLA